MLNRRLRQAGRVVAIVLNGDRCSHELVLVWISLGCFRSEEQSAVAAGFACFFWVGSFCSLLPTADS